MNFTFEERPDSRQQTLNPPTITLVYKAVGEQDNSLVSAYAYSGTAATVYASGTVLYRQDIRLDPDGFAQYVVTVPYATKHRQRSSGGAVGSYTWNFDTTGATVNLKAAKQHVASYPTAAAPNDNPHKGLIGANGGDVQGADIIIPACKLTVQFRHALAVVTMPFVKTLMRYTGRTNSVAFLQWGAGELLFLGATGSDGSEAEAEVSYHFAASEDETLTIGDITGIAKGGWHYVWIEYVPADVASSPAMQPKRVHVERVYDAINFATVFGWS